MANQELLDLIRQRVTSGVSRADIERELHTQGFSSDEIADAFLRVGIDALAANRITDPASVQAVSSAPMPTTSLPRFSELLKNAWALVKARSATVFGIAAIIALPRALLQIAYPALGAAPGQMPPMSATLALLWLFYLIAYMWGVVALLHAVTDTDERITISQAFAKSRTHVLSWAWIMILVSASIFGGILLFVIPGVIFSIWFSFAAFVLVVENIRGMAALSQSKKYVRGRVIEVFGLAFLFGLLYIPYMIVYVILLVVAGFLFPIVDIVVQALLGMATTVLFLPLNFAFQFGIYQKLKEIQGMVPEKKSAAGIVAIIIFGGLIGIAFFGIFAAIILASLGTARVKATDRVRISNIETISTTLELYAAANNSYPTSLDELVPGFISQVPIDVGTRKPYDYQPAPDDRSYKLCATLDDASTTLTATDLARESTFAEPGRGATFANGEYCESGSLSETPAATTRSAASTTDTGL